jgi:hypothetical protein
MRSANSLIMSGIRSNDIEKSSRVHPYARTLQLNLVSTASSETWLFGFENMTFSTFPLKSGSSWISLSARSHQIEPRGMALTLSSRAVIRARSDLRPRSEIFEEVEYIWATDGSISTSKEDFMHDSIPLITIVLNLNFKWLISWNWSKSIAVNLSKSQECYRLEDMLSLWDQHVNIIIIALVSSNLSDNTSIRAYSSSNLMYFEW